MWLQRPVLRYGVVGGVAALVGWAASEGLGTRNGVMSGLFAEALTCGLIGGVIGAGISLAAYRPGKSLGEMARRAVAGLMTGSFAGAIGMSLGHALLDTWSGGRAVGWALMGAGVGAAKGLYERSPSVVRQGVIAAAVGGLAGGLPFGLVYSLASRTSDAGGRAAAFVLLGACVGASVGLSEAGLAKVIRIGVESIRLDSRKRRPAPSARAKAEEPLVTPAPVIQSKPNSPAAKPARPVVANPPAARPAQPVVANTPASKPAQPVVANTPASKPAQPVAATGAKRQPSGMTPCPKCKRPVPGTRPYCVFCKISF
jgi:hypothetical protein